MLYIHMLCRAETPKDHIRFFEPKSNVAVHRLKSLMPCRLLDSMLVCCYISPMRKVTVRISDELFKKLGHYCVDADKSVNEVITDLLEKLVSEGKKTKR